VSSTLIDSPFLANAATAFSGAYVAERLCGQQLEEVTVTTRVHELPLADVGISFSALSGRQVCQPHQCN
jgi:hypothetical protein